MKTIEILALRSLQALTVILGSTILVAMTYAIVQVALGNYHSTACREF
jgi:hypothetical protein